ncbi:hypothetical protein ABS71_15210 [bacterium SCN 62-11]|nr:MAG: hypothetical protein ABS71_15210 [bacterium SCN 62-11]
MAISGISNLSFGTTYQPGKPDEIKSDGRVDDRFVTQGDSFIQEITDPRIQQFCKTGQAPSDDWKPHKLGGFDSPNQSLFTEEGQVVLRSNGPDDLRHLIKAPFDPSTGQVDLQSSSEGFDTRPKESGKTLTFTLPAGSNVEFGGVLDLDDPNSLGMLLSK